MMLGKKGNNLITRRKKYRYTLIILLIFTGGVFVMHGADIDDNQDVDNIDIYHKQFLLPTRSSSNLIPNDERAETMMNAVKGDGVAARRLERHFFTGRGDYYTGVFWLTIGAENDNSEAQYGLAILLLDNKIDKDFHQRGVFWLHKMASIDYRDTEEWLEKIGFSLDTAQPPCDELFSFKYTTLTREQMFQCKEGALQGSGQAALILAQYYNEIAKDTVSAEYWYRIGAQNGNIECQYQYGRILSGKQDMLDQERGKFWINHAIQNGYDFERATN